MDKIPEPVFENAQSLDELHTMLEEVKMKNGWAKPTPSLYPEPKKKFVPAHWRFKDARAALHQAGSLVSTEHAERRNLIMANPIPGNDYATVASLVGAYQMVKAGEIARSHRHSPNAMRVILEGDSQAFTVVDGEAIPMMPGDVLLTPNGCYHGHDNQSRNDSYWIDFLDVPLVQFLGPMFFQIHPKQVEHVRQISPKSEMRFAFSDFSKEILQIPKNSSGVRELELGPQKICTFDRFAIALDAHQIWTCDKTTANQLFVVLKGTGTTTVENQMFTWERGDIIAIPSWYNHQHQVNEDTLLLRVSDLPLLKMLHWDNFTLSD
jgi:gentisate 1,2-dioxygenase